MVKRPRVALIDDDPNFMDLFVRAMQVECDQVTIKRYNTGTDLLSDLLASTHSDCPHLILMDLSLPGRNGIEVAQAVRQMHSFRAIPILLLTSSDQPKEVQHAYEQGLNAYISKPFSYQEMKVLVKQICDYWLTAGQLPNLE